ncbi:phage tail tape measure protein, partial [Candidatus Pacearchaeota archaeon]|nr:phage tail tape measure protein [Candidatus Pacearchaeota archaeon]
MADLSVNVLFRLKDQLSGKFAQMSKQFDTFRKKMDITAAKMQKVGRTMSTHLTLPILGLGALAGRTAVKFDDSMRKVQAITKATGGEFTGLRDLAMKLGQDTKFTASQAAEGMTFLGMAGLNVNEVMSALPKTLQLAAAGGITLAEAADISTNVMTAMGKTTEDLTHINDVLASTATSTNTSILELAEGMKNVAGFASEVGISTEELSAQLGKMASGGEKGGIAGTLLRNAFQALLKPTAKMNKLFKQSGVDISNFVTSGGKIKDFNGLMEKLTKGGANASQIMQAFGERGGRAIISLMKTGGPNLKELTTQLVNSQGAAAKMAATMESGPGGVFRRLKSVVESLAIAMADVFLPVITRIIEIIIPVVRWFANLNKVVKGVALTVLFMA